MVVCVVVVSIHKRIAKLRIGVNEILREQACVAEKLALHSSRGWNESILCAQQEGNCLIVPGRQACLGSGVIAQLLCSIGKRYGRLHQLINPADGA